MNCRRVCGLLSAYLDAELALQEMDLISIHLRECPYCRGEHQSLLDTKRLLVSLAHRTPRTEIESLLRSEEDPRFAESGSSSFFRGVLRPKPLTATALLSLAGLWIASASLDSPADGVASGSGAISSQLSAAAMPGFGMGARSLRYLNDMIHSSASSPGMVPERMDGLVLSPASPCALPSAGNNLPYNNPISLSSALSTTTDSRQGNSVTISIYTVSATESSVAVYRGESRSPVRYSVSANRGSLGTSERLR